MSYYARSLGAVPYYMRTSSAPTIDEAVRAMAGAASYYQKSFGYLSSAVNAEIPTRVQAARLRLYQAMKQIRDGMAHWCAVLAPLLNLSESAVYSEIAAGLSALGYDIRIDSDLEQELSGVTATVLADRLVNNMAKSGVAADPAFVAKTIAEAMNASASDVTVQQAAIDAVVGAPALVVAGQAPDVDNGKSLLFAGAAAFSAWLVGLI